MYRSQGRHAEAEPIYQRTLAIGEKVLGPNHPHVANRLNNLAGLYSSQGRFDEAEPLYQRALTIWRSRLGETHPKTVTVLGNLAVFYGKWGKKDKAAEYALLAKKAKAEQP